MSNELNSYTLSSMNKINIMIKVIANKGEAVLNGFVYSYVFTKEMKKERNIRTCRNLLDNRRDTLKNKRNKTQNRTKRKQEIK